MRTIKAGALTADAIGRDIEIRNPFAVGWVKGHLERLEHRHDMTVLYVKHRPGDTREWAIMPGDYAEDIRVLSVEAEAAPMSDFERRWRAASIELPACPHPGCNAAAGEPCVLADDHSVRPPHTAREPHAPIPAPVPDDARSTPEEHAARVVAHTARGYGKRNAALVELEVRSSVLGPCPECLVGAGEPCVGLPGESAGLLGRIHGDRVLAAKHYEAEALRRMREGRI